MDLKTFQSQQLFGPFVLLWPKYLCMRTLQSSRVFFQFLIYLQLDFTTNETVVDLDHQL